MDIERIIELCDSARKYVAEMQETVDNQRVFDGLDDVKRKFYFLEESVAEEIEKRTKKTSVISPQPLSAIPRMRNAAIRGQAT